MGNGPSPVAAFGAGRAIAASCCLALASAVATADERLAQPEPIAVESVEVVEPTAEREPERLLDGYIAAEDAHVPNFKEDWRELPRTVWSEVKALPSFYNLAVLGTAGGLSAISANNWDQQVRDDTAMHARRWGGLDNVLDVAGHPGTQLGVTGSLYAWSLYADNEQLHSFSRDALHALAITDVADIALKYSFNTTRPNGEHHGFPSGHTASSFALAAVINEHYGPAAGVGAYLFAGMVGWSRIDDRKHDLSDVIFGAALGYVVGRTVVHFDDRCRIRPSIDANGNFELTFWRMF